MKERNPEESCRQQLYNLRVDPLEQQDLMERGHNRKIVGPMRQTLMDAVKVLCFTVNQMTFDLKEMMLGDIPRQEPAADPSLNGGVLSTNWC